jgi:hypothetical protein
VQHSEGFAGEDSGRNRQQQPDETDQFQVKSACPNFLDQLSVPTVCFVPHFGLVTQKALGSRAIFTQRSLDLVNLPPNRHQFSAKFLHLLIERLAGCQPNAAAEPVRFTLPAPAATSTTVAGGVKNTSFIRPSQTTVVLHMLGFPNSLRSSRSPQATIARPKNCSGPVGRTARRGPVNERPW